MSVKSRDGRKRKTRAVGKESMTRNVAFLSEYAFHSRMDKV